MNAPFEHLAVAYHQAGIHPFPVEGKRPCVKAYASRRPGEATLRRWTSVFGHANLGLPTRRERLLVLDADDSEIISYLTAIAGPSPLHVQTRRGVHLYFADPSSSFAGSIHPGGKPFDIKAGGPSDFVLLPGSVNQGFEYALLDYAGMDQVQEFARRLRELPSLAPSAYSELTQKASGFVAVHLPKPDQSRLTVLDGARLPEGTRNSALFRAACLMAHEVRRGYGDGDAGQQTLFDRLTTLNATLCDPPLEQAEVSKLARDVWKRTLAGINRPPPLRGLHIQSAMERVGRDVRGLALWGWLTQSDLAHCELDLSPVALARVIPEWKRHDADAAIQTLRRLDILEPLNTPRKGRGNGGRYRLREPLTSRVPFAQALDALKGDSAALALLVLLVETWGPCAYVPISVDGMSRRISGPFGQWTKVRLLRARNALARARLIDRLPEKRVGVRRPRAMFQLRAGDVLKMLEIVPEEIHRPPTGNRGSQGLAGTIQPSIQTELRANFAGGLR